MINALKLLAFCSVLVIGLSSVHGQQASVSESSQVSKRIHVVYFGGMDCPPCEAFRAAEFPKFKSSPEFSSVDWSFVPKVIRSPVPSSFFLPTTIKPLREALVQATGGNAGSAQVVIFVDGKVHDVFFGSKDAAFYQKVVRSLENGKEAYLGERCVERAKGWACKVKG